MGRWVAYYTRANRPSVETRTETLEVHAFGWRAAWNVSPAGAIAAAARSIREHESEKILTFFEKTPGKKIHRESRGS